MNFSRDDIRDNRKFEKLMHDIGAHELRKDSVRLDWLIKNYPYQPPLTREWIDMQLAAIQSAGEQE